jgi:glycosyltransferase involved in cell wall biosynthesis
MALSDTGASTRREHASAASRELRVAVVGISTDRTCGVRDHAVLLAEGLAAQGVSCSLHWLWREGQTFASARAQISAWTRRLAGEAGEAPPDAVLLHYSVFPYSYRGVPVFVGRTLAALGDLRVPIVPLLHEYAYPWGRGGVRGATWAATQRAALIGVMRASAAAVVTAPFRVDWLESRVWLPRRPLAVAPVFSNLPPPSLARDAAAQDDVIGLFGYAYEGAAIAPVIDALRRLRETGAPVRLALLGAPGRSSAAGEAWERAARAGGVERLLSFSGRLSAQELSDALAACTVLLSADPSGPTSRKTTLAASLASGAPVVAIDGQRTWRELREAGAATVVPGDGGALAAAVLALLEDRRARDALGSRGREFARSAMSVERSAATIAELLRDAVAAQRP